MKGIKKIGEDNTTYIAIVEGDDDNIYLTTKSTNGRLTFILKKNESETDFCYNELFGGKAELNGTDYIIVETDEIYSAEHATGHVDISTITSQTLLSPDTFEQEVKDVNGNIKTSTDMSQYFPDSMPKSSLTMSY